MINAPQLASLVALGGVLTLGAQELRIQGGTPDDQALARSAFGRPSPVDGAALSQGKAAILATDRFRGVTAEIKDGPVVQLDPWPSLAEVLWRSEGLPKALRKTLMPSLRPGIRVGNQRMEEWRQRAEVHLREAGYPEALVAMSRQDGDRKITVEIRLGLPALIQSVDIEGPLAPYGKARLLKLAKVRPGRTLWTDLVRRQAAAAIRKRFRKDRRFEGTVDFEWKGAGVLRMKLQPGPVIRVGFEGEKLPWWGLKEWVPLLHAERFSIELRDEGDRRLLRHFLEEGYLDAQVSHRYEVVRGTPENPEEARLTYVIDQGPKVLAQALRFEGNSGVPEKELRKAADLPSRTLKSFWTSPPEASPGGLSDVEARVKAYYLLQGYPEVRLRRHLDRKAGRTTVVLIIREGERKELEDLELELPKGAPWVPLDLGEALLRVIAEQPEGRPSGDERSRRYSGDQAGVSGTLTWLPSDPEATTERVVLKLDPAIRFVKNELAPVLSTLQQKVASLGSPRPQVRLEPPSSEDGKVRIRISVPSQPLAKIGRLAIFGADDTRGRVLVREANLPTGAPLDPRKLATAQVKVGNLRAFQRVDLMGLQDAPVAVSGPLSWQPGDLWLRLEERSPWAFTGGFGYDKSQGYHFTGGIQRLNIGGEGQTLDLGIRAGDATLDSEALRKAFPTGDFRRSVDSYGLTYTDPALGLNLQGWMPWLPDRAQYRLEGTYIEELQTAYRIRRRRVLNDLEWRIDTQRVLRAGHRFERVEVASGVVDINNDDLLNKTAHTPGRAVISAPYFHFLRDARDNPFDPKRGTYLSARIEFANQMFGTSTNTSFVKLDLRHQWVWPLGRDGKAGVLAAGVRVGVARPTDRSADELPLSERFFAGGPFTHRGVEPDFLGPRADIPIIDSSTRLPRITPPLTQQIPLGGQALALVNVEYRFPLWGDRVWGEAFVDSGQVYQYLQRPEAWVRTGSESLHPPFLTALGIGLIWKVGIPIKLEYAADVRRILGRPRSVKDRETQLRSVLISAGFQF